jgi:hypothetical protein
VTVSGRGWPPSGGGLYVYIGPVLICAVYEDATGTIPATACTVPSNAPTGTFDVVATDNAITTTGNAVTIN